MNTSKVPLLYFIITVTTIVVLSIMWNMALRNNNVELYELAIQQNEAIQYLGNRESAELENCYDANEALIRATSVSQLNEAVKNTPLPPLKG